MTDKKISQLSDGTSFQAGDEAVVNRSGTNYKVDPTQFGSSIDVTGTVTATEGDIVSAQSSRLRIRNTQNNTPTVNHLELLNNANEGLKIAIPRSGATSIASIYYDQGIVFNEGGVDADFRVESDTNTHALFVDAGNSRVGINQSSPATALDVVGTVTADGLTVSSDGTFTNPNGVTLNLERNDTFLEDGNLISGLRFGHNDGNGTPPHGTGIKVTADSTFGAMFLDILAGNRSAWEDNDKAIRVSDTETSFYQPVVFNEHEITFGDNSTTIPNFNYEADSATSGATLGQLAYKWNGTKIVTVEGLSGDDTTNKDNGFFRLRVAESGNLNSGGLFVLDHNGNAGFGTSSPGATLDVNGNIIADGVYLGGTGAANLLDDYEEGTWTPTTASDATGAFSAQEGFYRKVGNVVHLFGQVNISTNFSSNVIGGLPFNVANLFSISVYSGAGTVLSDVANSIGVSPYENTATIRFLADFNANSSYTPSTTGLVYRFYVAYMTS